MYVKVENHECYVHIFYFQMRFIVGSRQVKELDVF